MNQSSKAYDAVLEKSISHYRSFRVMLPFVGEHYESARHGKLLVIGESFYFPKDSTSHKAPGSWYALNQWQLTEKELEHINCRGLLECDWKPPGHKMYRELNACLASQQLEPSDQRAVSHICFTNAFLRPATEPGKSFKHCCTKQDIQVGTDTIVDVIKALTPDLVVFASCYAWCALGSAVKQQVSETTRFDFVSHPTDSFHWNVRNYKHGRAKFMSLLDGWARGR